jgi:hypothetical protein
MRFFFSLFTLCIAAFPFALTQQHPTTNSNDMNTLARCSVSRVDDKVYLSTLLAKVAELYTTRSHDTQRAIISDFYAPNMSFEDPLMVVHGTENFRLQFLSLIKFFSSISVTYTDAVTAGDTPVEGYVLKTPGSMGPDSTDVVLRNRQNYTFGRESKLAQWVLPAQVDLDVLTTLTIGRCPVGDAGVYLEGKIVKHRDVWVGDHAVQNFGLYQRYMKNVTGSVTSGLFRLIGW